ncbi:DUF2971 domain-containing protein [Celerinatantimonas diazotrophica]|nr:DUF2971 domain-containing protein [Celerinatantimonas diazotrophica]
MHIYQYTDLNAVKKILKTGKLWATHYKYLNDYSEVLKGIEILVDSISDTKKLSNTEKNALKKETMNSLDDLDIFVSSLCLAGDELTMWRTYGNCAVIFNMSLVTLALTCEGSFRQNSVESCVYPKNNKDINLSRQFDSLLFLYDEYYLGSHKDWFISSLVYDATSIKHDAFYAEQEHRAVVSLNKTDNTPILYRKRGEKDIPYIEMVLPQSCIEGVFIGPGKDQDKLVLDMKEFLQENKFDNVVIYKSSIPFV